MRVSLLSQIERGQCSKKHDPGQLAALISLCSFSMVRALSQQDLFDLCVRFYNGGNNLVRVPKLGPLTLSHNIPRLLIFPQPDKLRMPQVTIRRPFGGSIWTSSVGNREDG
jgi:hypothetical protein